MDFLVTNGPALLFYVFAAIAVVAAIAVITLRNPMYSAISLLVCFLSMAALFLLRHAEFIAVVQVFVYGGGIMVVGDDESSARLGATLFDRGSSVLPETRELTFTVSRRGLGGGDLGRRRALAPMPVAPPSR